MTLHQLRIFAEVAKHLNVTKASDELHISQPSVSQQLKLLQDECKVRLYKKSGRGIELTQEGNAFLTDAQSVLKQVDKIQGRFARNQNEPDSLVVGGSNTQSVSFLPLLMAVFKETHPQVQLSLRTDTSRMVERLVLNSEVEIAVITDPSNAPTLSYEPCRTERFLFFTAPSHPLAKRKELTMAQMTQAPLIFRRSKSGRSRVWDFLKQVENQGFKLNIAMHCESAQAVKTAVSTGMGLGILYQDHVEAEIKKGKLKQIKVPELKMELESFIVYPKDKPLSANANDLLSVLREWPRKILGTKGSLRVANL